MYNLQLETVLVVADAGSFNKAAAQLFISPPAVIKQINQLEATPEVTLFERTHRGLRLTEAGKSLYRDTERQSCIVNHLNWTEAALTALSALSP